MGCCIFSKCRQRQRRRRRRIGSRETAFHRCRCARGFRDVAQNVNYKSINCQPAREPTSHHHHHLLLYLTGATGTDLNRETREVRNISHLPLCARARSARRNGGSPACLAAWFYGSAEWRRRVDACVALRMVFVRVRTFKTSLSTADADAPPNQSCQSCGSLCLCCGCNSSGDRSRILTPMPRVYVHQHGNA